MPSIISADNGSTSGSSGLKYNGGSADGILQLQSGANIPAVNISAAQIVTLANPLPVGSGGTGSTSTTFVNLTSNVTGTLPIANGGTGSTATATAGAVIYGTGTAYGVTAAGTSGQVLTSAGSSAPTWSTPSAGAMTLISTQTASSSATIAWTGLSGYNHYMLIIDGLMPSSNSYLQLQFGTGSGPTYVTSGYYYVQNNIYSNNVGSGYSSYVGDSGSSTQINIAGGSGTTGLEGTITFFNATYTIYSMTNSKDTFIGGTNSYRNNGGVTTFASTISGQLNSNTTAKTAIKLFLTSGNITSGTFSLYGVSS